MQLYYFETLVSESLGCGCGEHAGPEDPARAEQVLPKIQI